MNLSVNEMMLGVMAILWGIVGILLGIIWNDNKAKIKASEIKINNINERLQKVEDIQGTAIVNLEKKFEKLEVKFDILTEKVNDLTTYITKATGTELRILEALENFNKK